MTITDTIFGCKYAIVNDTNITIYVTDTKRNRRQGMLSFDKRTGYDLYKWYDEGRFPLEFDTSEQLVDGYRGDRLKITGIDDV